MRIGYGLFMFMSLRHRLNAGNPILGNVNGDCLAAPVMSAYKLYRLFLFPVVRPGCSSRLELLKQTDTRFESCSLRIAYCIVGLAFDGNTSMFALFVEQIQF